jgi:hypothetical protein
MLPGANYLYPHAYLECALALDGYRAAALFLLQFFGKDDIKPICSQACTNFTCCYYRFHSIILNIDFMSTTCQ